MKTRLSFGQFYNADSAIHRMDPRIKIHVFLFFLISIFLMDTIWGLLLLTVIAFGVAALSNVPPSMLARSFKACWIICLFPLIFNLFIGTGQPLVSFGILAITDVGVYRAVFFTLRIMLVLMIAAELMLTTSPLSLCDACAYLLNPLRHIGVPADDVSMMVSIALRYIPTLGDEYANIKDAQIARGADFDKGGFMKKVGAFGSILSPLFISAYRRAGDLATAMESRCYGFGQTRTHRKTMHTKPSDWVCLAVSICILLAGVLVL